MTSERKSELNESDKKHTHLQERPLQSWKEIAAYLERDERTAQRWEKSAGLPVRRMIEGKGSSVYAYPSEIEAWRSARRPNAHISKLWRRSLPIAFGIVIVVMGALFVRYGPILNPPNPNVEAAEGIVVHEVWSGPAVDASGTPSPDGRYLSFVDWQSGNLAVREIESGVTRNLTTWAHPKPPWTHASNSRISPDGSSAAYAWCEDDRNYCDLHVIGMDGSGERTLLSCKDQSVYPKSWSMSSEFILALRVSRGGVLEILLVGLHDGTLQVLKTGGRALGPTYWAFSPDDRYLAYDFPVLDQDNKYDIALLTTDGLSEKPLVEHPANDRLLGWIPKRDQILFLSDREGNWDVWIATIEDGKVKGSPRPLKREVGEIRPLGFSREGTFFFRTYTRYFTLQTAPFEASTGKLETELAEPILGSNFSPVWSPDGEKLAYVREEKSPDGSRMLRSLEVRNYKTGEVVELVSGLNVRFPRWSPDGSQLVFRGFDWEGSTSGYYRVNVSDGKITPALPEISGVWWKQSAEWALDGKSIYYVNDGSLMLRELDSKRERQLYSDPELTGLIALSPDGRWLAFATDPSEHGTGSLLVRSSSDGKVREVFKKPEEAFRIAAACWSPDSEYILFVIAVKNPGNSELWRISPEGGNAEKLWQSEKSLGGVSIHPEGHQIAFSLYTQDFGVWAMEEYLAAPE